MERKKNLILILLAASSLIPVSASYRTEIYKCYISGNMSKWKSIIDMMALEKNNDPSRIIELVNYQYGYVGWAIGMKKNDEAKTYLELAEKNLQLVERHKSYESVVNAYKAAFYGFRIGMNKVLAPFLGGKSLDCARLAVRLDENNYLGYVQLGNSEFYMPAAFGGSKSKAIEFFTKAEKIMESDPSEIKENWNYLSLLTIIAQAYSYTKEFDRMKMYLDKILSIEPEFAWVKNELYQQLYNKMKN